MIDIEKAKNVFKNYVEKYDKTNPRIAFKIAHTYRVVDTAKIIAEELELNEEQILLAELIGLLHDIGRFEQVRRYNTFTDRLSVDHADLGVEVLKENNFLSQFCEDEKYYKTILVSIKNHNKFRIEEGLNEEENLQCRIIRDADKIDIFNSIRLENLDTLMDDSNIDDSVVTPYVLENFYKGIQTNRKLLKTPIDEYISNIAMVFDLNFKPSFKLLKEKNYINEIIDRCSNKEMDNIRKFINKYIEERA